MGRRIKELAATVGIAVNVDGVVGLAVPRRRGLLWKISPEGYREGVRWFAGRPSLVRLVAAAGLGLGLVWALGQYPEGG